MKKIIMDAEEHALQTIKQHRAKLDTLIQLLEKRETLYKEQIVMCLGVTENKKPEHPQNKNNPTA